VKKFIQLTGTNAQSLDHINPWLIGRYWFVLISASAYFYILNLSGFA
jgi:hypothetical protein